MANHHHPYKNHHNFGTKSPIFGHIPCLGVAKTLDLSVVTFIMDALADRDGFTNSQFERCKKSFEHFDVNGDVDSWGWLSIGKVRRNKGTNVVETTLNYPFGNSLYHPFIVILGIVYYCFSHITAYESGMCTDMMCGCFTLYLNTFEH